MKNKSLFILAWVLVALAFVTLPIAAFAAENAPAVVDAVTPPAAGAGITAENIVAWLTPILVPLIISGMKLLAPKIPSWLLPILAPFLGIVVDALASLATGHVSNLWLAALLGLAGVGVREVKDQLTPAKPEPRAHD